MPDDMYQFWRRRMAGEVVPIHDGEPQAGFYRLKTRDGNSHPVAYWFAKDGTLRCRVGDKDINEQTANERWPWASKSPITHEVYKAVVAGEPWPDQHEGVTRDRANSVNAPEDQSFEGLKDRIEDLARDAQSLIDKGAAPDQSAADRASDLANRLAELQKQADAARAVEKKPHDEAGKAVQAKWLPVLGTADVFKRIKAIVITPFLVAEDNRRREAAEAARNTAEATGTMPPDEVRLPTPKAGSNGRRSVALRDHTIVTITDRDALLIYFKDRAEITEALQRMAELAIRAGVTPPGVTTKTEKRAA